MARSHFWLREINDTLWVHILFKKTSAKICSNWSIIFRKFYLYFKYVFLSLPLFLQPELENWHTAEVNNLIDNYLKEMLLIDAGRNFMIRAVASDVYSIKLLNQLKVLLMENNHSQVSLSVRIQFILFSSFLLLLNKNI